MNTGRIPFNIELIKLDEKRLAPLRPVTSVDYFENTDGGLHEDGLFSQTIFGRVGDELRDLKFSYINIRTSVFHPVIYHRLCQLKGLYKGIMAGTAWAIWDDQIKDFKATTEVDPEGATGYNFFVKHWADIKFTRNDSDIRETRIKVIEQNRDRALCDKILVMPAGLRDIEKGDDGREVVADINAIYRKILAVARTIADTDYVQDTDAYNLQRVMIQNSFNEIYDLIKQMLSDKKGFLQSKWASRGVVNGTRNVITAMDTSVVRLDAPNAPKYTDTIVGLHQAIKGLLPIALHHLRNSYLSEVFSAGNGNAYLVHPRTLKRELVEIGNEAFDRWTTREGLEKVINSFGRLEIRHRNVKVGKYYVALVYKPSTEKVFKVFYDIDDLPEGFDRSAVRPITLTELIYLSGYKVWNNYYAFVTRYPVTGTGSCYPASLYVKTTVVSEMRRELNDQWEVDEDSGLALEYPVYEPLAFVDSHIIHPTRIAGLGADYDGDTASCQMLHTDESIAEVKAILGSRNAYLDPRGGLNASASVDTIELVLRSMTG